MKRLLMITMFLGVLMVLVQESRAQKDLSCKDWLGLNQLIKIFYLTAFSDGAAVSSAEIAYREKRDLIKAGWPDDLEVGLVLVMVDEFCKRSDNQNRRLLEAMVYIVNRTNNP